MNKSYEEQMALKSRLEQAKEKTLKSAVGFAMAQGNFDAKECLVYLNLAFREDNVDAFTACSSWLSKHGALSGQDAKSWALKSFYEQKPYALAMLAHAFPSVIEEEYDGIDIWKNGLCMAMVRGDEASATMLGQALGKVDPSGERMRQSIDMAFDFMNKAVDLQDFLPSDVKYGRSNVEGFDPASVFAAKCEKAILAVSSRAPKSKGPGPLTL